MSQKGLISFVLVLAFIAVYFSLVFSLNSFNSEKNFTEAKLVEIENNSFKRNLLENAVDSLIEETMQEEIAFGSDDPEKINEKISAKLFELFSGMEEKGTEFKETLSGKKYSETEIKGEKISKKFIKENSKTIVFSLENRLYEVQFIFTGGINKNNLAGAEIKENSSTQKFFIPLDYTVKIVSLRLV
ncbi:MAG: hypothetical protein ABH986_02630 [archaeon]